MRTLRPEDDGYPAVLRRLRRAPRTLHVDGSLEGLERAVGIVGTRRATPRALDLARRLGRDLASAGVLVVSGGAEGIDRAAHEGALEAPGGRTIAVLPTALASPYPRAHAALFERIASRGARLTEHVSARVVRPAHFLERNRVIAALSRVVVVVQAPVRSGALRTALDARCLAIPVLAVPWSPDEPAAAGSLALLAEGAGLCRDAADVLAALGERARPSPPPPLGPGALDPDARAIWALLDDTASDRESVVVRSGLAVGRAQAALVQLVMAGVVHEDARGVRRR